VGRTTRLGIAEKELTMLRRTLAALLMLAAIGTPAVGQQIAYDGFNYATGTNLNGFNGGSGWADVWSEPSFGTGNANDNVPETIQAGSLTFSNLATGGNRVVTGGRFSYDIRNLGTALGTAGTTRYASFLIRRDTAGPNPVNNGPDYGGLVFGDEHNPNSLFVGKPGGGSVTNFAMENGAGAGQVASSRPETLGTTALLVVRFDFTSANDTFRLYVNPAPGAAEPTVADATKNDLNMGMFVGVSISTGAAATWSFDEIRVGNNFADVIPVPEPNTILLPLSGGLAIWWRRRSRHR
jgi:hypothetical protein